MAGDELARRGWLVSEKNVISDIVCVVGRAVITVKIKHPRPRGWPEIERFIKVE